MGHLSLQSTSSSVRKIRSRFLPAPVTTSSPVYEQFIPQGRASGVGLGLILQYPEQVAQHIASARPYTESLNNVKTKLIGNIATDAKLAESMAHENLSAIELRNRVSRRSASFGILSVGRPRTKNTPCFRGLIREKCRWKSTRGRFTRVGTARLVEVPMDTIEAPRLGGGGARQRSNTSGTLHRPPTDTLCSTWNVIVVLRVSTETGRNHREYRSPDCGWDYGYRCIGAMARIAVDLNRPSMATAAQVVPSGSTDNHLLSSCHVSPSHPLVMSSAANPLERNSLTISPMVSM